MRTKMNGLTPVLGVALLLALPACSSMPDKRAPSTYKSTLDSEVMAAVESGAMREGTQVYWINPPRKSKKD